jgi:hypothetical protein
LAIQQLVSWRFLCRNGAQPLLSPNPVLFHNAPKEGGKSGSTESYSLACHIGSRLIQRYYNSLPVIGR